MHNFCNSLLLELYNMQRYFIFCSFVFLFVTGGSYAQVNKQDSLEALLPQAEGLQKGRLLVILSEEIEYNNPGQALKYAQEALQIAQQYESKLVQAQALRNIGTIYRILGDYVKAMDFTLQALGIYENLSNDEGLSETNNNVGIIHYLQNESGKAMEFFRKALSTARQINEQAIIAKILNNIGNVYSLREDYDNAEMAYQEAYEINQNVNNYQFAADNLINLGTIFLREGNFKQGLEVFFQAIEMYEQINSKEGIAATHNIISEAYLDLDSLDKALSYAELGLKYAQEIAAKDLIADALKNLYRVYKVKGAEKKALQYLELFTAYEDSILNEENNERIARLQITYDFSQQEAQIKLLNEEKKQQQLILIVFLIGSVFLIVAAFFIYRNYKSKQKQAKELQVANDSIHTINQELRKQKAIVEEKKEDLDSSINYAKRIQSAVLPITDEIQKSLEHFIFFRPRDVVSGDFYWYTETLPEPIYHERLTPEGPVNVFEGFTSEKQIIAAVDSTGHGIPGAFMSIVGSTLLHQIVNEQGISEPDEILEELHREVMRTLKQKQNKNNDGMDMALCTIDKEHQLLSYAGAHNPLIIVKDGEVLEIKADRKGIGGSLRSEDEEVSYTKHEIPIESPMMCYIFSDGYQDQFGGEQGRKFMKKKLYKLMLDLYEEDMQTQKEIFIGTFDRWQRDEIQVDDVILIGFRL